MNTYNFNFSQLFTINKTIKYKVFIRIKNFKFKNIIYKIINLLIIILNFM